MTGATHRKATRTEHLSHLVAFLRDQMRRHGCLPSQLSRELGLSRPTVGRWLRGDDIPSVRSCRMLSAYSGVSLQRVLSLCGHFPGMVPVPTEILPEFGDYARLKYPGLLEDDEIGMIESLLHLRRNNHRG